jgi:hypothetical protein
VTKRRAAEGGAPLPLKNFQICAVYALEKVGMSHPTGTSVSLGVARENAGWSDSLPLGANRQNIFQYQGFTTIFFCRDNYFKKGLTFTQRI